MTEPRGVAAAPIGSRWRDKETGEEGTVTHHGKWSIELDDDPTRVWYWSDLLRYCERIDVHDQR